MRRRIALSATALALVASVSHAPAIRARYSSREPAAGRVEFVWSGALTGTSLRIKARLDTDSATARAVVSTSPDFGIAIYSVTDTALLGVNDRVVDLPVTGLEPGAAYYYVIEVDGVRASDPVGRFNTVPAPADSFTFAFSACAQTGSDHRVFEAIRALGPLFFFHLGDFHYQNIGVNDPGLFRQAFRTVLASPGQAALYRDVPIAYMWDDHDYGPNNSDSTAPGRASARRVWQEYVPHYPLAAGGGDVPLHYSFRVGRVHFIVTDCRSARSPYGAPDGPQKTMLGADQKRWFMDRLLAARNAGGLIVWVNTLPWIGVTGDDGWYAYTHERREIANFLRNNCIRSLCMISGDAHMLAIDDGSNSDYADGGGAAFPVMQAAALDQSPSLKGGPYSHGAYPGRGQFGLVTVVDLDDSLVVDWQGRNDSGRVLVAYRFSVPGSCPIGQTGDLNGSGLVTSADIVILVNHLFKGGAAPQPCAAAADADCSGSLSTGDIITLVNFVFKAVALPCAPCSLL